jgi:nuclear GTP-binding protein
VGKSSVINALKREAVVAVGNTPGFTRVAQEVQLSSTVKILDCPGIIFGNSSGSGDSAESSAATGAILRNAIKVTATSFPRN